jgi:hypothetical protein
LPPKASADSAVPIIPQWRLSALPRYIGMTEVERLIAICDVMTPIGIRDRAVLWFCGLSIEDKLPDHSAFSRARNERFHDGDIFRRVFERVVSACIAAGLVGGKGFAVDANPIAADANKARLTPGAEWSKEIDPETAQLAVKDYLATLNDPAFGAASEVTPKFISPSDPAAQWTGALRNAAFFAYADNYLIESPSASSWMSRRPVLSAKPRSARRGR